MAANADLAALKRKLQRHDTMRAGRALASFGMPEIDAALASGGLIAGLHQFTADHGGNTAAFGVTAALCARWLAETRVGHATDAWGAAAAVPGKVLIIEGGLRDLGTAYPIGLRSLGLSSADVYFLPLEDEVEAMRAAHEALDCGAQLMVLLDLHSARKLDRVASQQLAFAARRTRKLLLVNTPAEAPIELPVTRWRVRSLPSRAARKRIGAPRFELDLLKSQFGHPGRWAVEWDAGALVFRDAREAAVGPARQVAGGGRDGAHGPRSHRPEAA